MKKKTSVFFAGLILAVISLALLLATCSLAGDLEEIRSSLDGGTFTLTVSDISELESQLSAQKGGKTPAKAGKLIVTFDLGNMVSPASNWYKLLEAIGAAGKYVELDLSVCTINNGTSTTFNPGSSPSTGKDRIVSISLPNVATDIPGGSTSSFAFLNFSNLKTASGSEITGIGSYTFYNCVSLSGVSFPKTTDIGGYAFYGCTNLSSILFENLENIGAFAFFGCSKLTIVYLPAAKDILGNAFGNSGITSINVQSAEKIYFAAFSNCKNLTSVTLPSTAEIIDGNPFLGCSSLTTFNVEGSGGSGQLNVKNWNNWGNNTPVLIQGTYDDGDAVLIAWPAISNGWIVPDVFKIGSYALCNNTNLLGFRFDYVTETGDSAFLNCIGLEIIDFYIVDKIGPSSFQGCTNLTQLGMPTVTLLLDRAFAYTGGADLEIWMGATPPTLGSNIFDGVNVTKNVTVKVPSGSKSSYYDNPTWKNAFIGLGTDGSGTVNDKITLFIEEY